MSKYSVKKPLTIIVCVIVVIALGFVSLTRMTPDLLPSIDLPYMVVMTTYPGATPEEVQEEVVEEEAIPFALVEEKPQFQGGDANTFSKWVSQHLEYPEIAKENGVSGRVMVQFTVNPNGSVSDVKVLRGVDPSLDREAVRVIQSSPKWTPGKQRDRAVKVTYQFPVIFQLR